MLVATKLGSPAIQYIEDSISYSFTLEKLLNRLPIELGVIETYLPDNANTIARENFHAYNFWSPEDQFAAESLIQDIVIQYLSQGKSHYALFEDPVVNTRSRYALSHCNQTMYKGEEIYYYVTSTNKSEEVRKIMGMALTWRAVGVCFHTDQEVILGHGLEIADHLFEIAVNTIDILLIGAYDEGSWLIWTPPQGWVMSK